jgi:hypothetical protein
MKTRSVYLLSRVLLVLILWSTMAAQPAHAARTWVVTSLGDNSPWTSCTAGDCTLRSAINSASSGDTIIFAPSVIGTIHLLTSYRGFTIDKNLTIDGPGAFKLTISGSGGGSNKDFSVFTVNSGGYLKVSGLSITFGWNLSGGAALIQPGGTLVVDRCNFFDNYAREDGAVFYNHGTVTITRSFFGENHAAQPSGEEGYGGAIENNQDGVMTITNSTFAHNGAIAGGAIDNMGTLTIVNSTIKDNSALESGGVLNQFGYGGRATLKNVLLADNENGNCSGALEIGSTHNLSTDATCSPGFDQKTPTELALGALKDIPAYFPLNHGSVAIDAGTNDACPPTDQTGKLRPLDGDENGTAVCDVGAFEAWPLNIKSILLPIVLRP